MYYLKCPECGNYSEIFNESQNCCSVCTARFENDFQSWKKENKQGTFQQYLETVCIPEKNVPAIQPETDGIKNKRRIKPSTVVIVVALLAVVAAALVSYFTSPVIRDLAVLAF